MNLKINKNHWSVWIYRATFEVPEACLPTNLCNFFWPWLIALLVAPAFALHLIAAYLIDKKNPDNLHPGVWFCTLALGAVVWRLSPFLELSDIKVDYIPFYVFYIFPLLGTVPILAIWGVWWLVVKILSWWTQYRFNRKKDLIKSSYFSNGFGYAGWYWEEVLTDRYKQRVLLRQERNKRKLAAFKPKSDGIWKIIRKKYSSFKDNYCPHIEWLDKK